MTKQTIIAIAVGILILFGATGAFLYSQSKPNATSQNVANESSPTPTINNELGNSITQLLQSGETAKCTFLVDNEDGTTQGTVYTSGENARANITTTSNGKENKSYLIKVDSTFFMWSDSLPIGIKMNMNTNEIASKLQENSEFASLDPSKKIDFKCTKWTQDPNVFKAPSNIKFTSFGTSTSSNTPSKTNISPTKTIDSIDKQTQCKICNSLTGEAKSTCLTQFNCL